MRYFRYLVQAAGHIIVKVLVRILHRFADQRVCSKVHHRFRPFRAHQVGQSRFVGQVALDKFRAAVDGVSVPFGQVIENGDVVPSIEQILNANAADIAGPSCYKNFHGPILA